MELTASTAVLLVLVPVLVWRIYSRLKMVFQRQESVMWRHWVGAAGLPLLLLAAANNMRNDVLGLSMMAAGALAGGWIAVFALKKTRYENIDGLRFYFTPHARSGIVICMLFTARVLQIGVEFYLNRQAPIPRVVPADVVLHHPMTVVPFGLLIGYLSIYSIGLLRWRKSASRTVG